MLRAFRLRPGARVVVLVLLIGGVGAWVLSAGQAKPPQLKASSRTVDLRPTGYPQLVSVEPLPQTEVAGEECQWAPAGGQTALVSLLQQQSRVAGAAPVSAGDTRTSVILDRMPLRVIRDQSPTYSAVAVDEKNNEIVLQDENLLQIMVYDRLANTPPTAKMTEPKRVIGGSDTHVEFNCGLYIDPKNGDIYSISADTLDTVTIFSRNAKGNVPPDRKLHVPRFTFGIAVDEAAQELFLSVQAPPLVVVFPKYAKGGDKPLRSLSGSKTGLGDPHGVAVDTKNGLMFVANFGNAAEYSDKGGNQWPGAEGPGVGKDETAWLATVGRYLAGVVVPGSGRYEPPSITVYPIKASGDTPPLRTIKGPNTQLNWPSGVYLDSERGELYVANDAGDSILVFHASDSGNVAPTRVLKGAKTQIKNPTGVYVDTVNDELLVANMGNHRATVYSRTAQGDTPPIRTIRSAAEGIAAQMIGNPGAVGYDTKRNEILVPN